MRKRASGGECVAAASTARGGKCAVQTERREIVDNSRMVEALRAIPDEIRRVTALIQAVSEPLRALHRWKRSAATSHGIKLMLLPSLQFFSLSAILMLSAGRKL